MSVRLKRKADVLRIDAKAKGDSTLQYDAEEIFSLAALIESALQRGPDNG